MRFTRAPYAVLERAARGMTAPEIDRELGVSSSLVWARYLIRQRALRIVDLDEKPYRFEATPLGVRAIAAGPCAGAKCGRKPVNPVVRAGFVDLVLRVFLVRGGPLGRSAIAEDVQMSPRLIDRVLIEMRDEGLLRQVMHVHVGRTRSRSRRWALTHAGVERLIGMQNADWRARIASVLPEAI